MKIKQDKNDSSNNEENTAKSPAQLSPLSLFFMGATFCAVELTSALPYFGFLTLLAGYNLTVPFVFSYLLLYCFMYVLPLLVLYVGYNKLRGTRIIQRLEGMLQRVSSYIVPGALGLVGILLLFHGGSSLV